MIRRTKIADGTGESEYTIMESDDFEYVDPTKYYAETYIYGAVSMMRDIITFEKPPIPIQSIEDYIAREAVDAWMRKLKEIEETPVPANLVAILNAQSKKQQVKLLRDVSISADQLISFIFRAWTDYGFSFSQYTSHHDHKGLDRTQMPKLVEINKEQVIKVGNTSLTDGQLKQAIEHRKVVVSKFLDKGNEWHCLFITFESLKGKESWKNGQPHYHYISDKFGISREDVVSQLKRLQYRLGNLPHIDLLDYDNTDE